LIGKDIKDFFNRRLKNVILLGIMPLTNNDSTFHKGLV